VFFEKDNRQSHFFTSSAAGTRKHLTPKERNRNNTLRWRWMFRRNLVDPEGWSFLKTP
jgi:hypothetical protein